MKNNKINLKFMPYPPCKGRKYGVILKLYRPFVCLICSSICNQHIISKFKVRFIGQLLRWFYKSRWGYKIAFSLMEPQFNKILDGSLFILCARTQKAAFKNLLKKLNYELCDYKALKRRQYVLNFTFLFLNLNNNDISDDIFIDILVYHEDTFKIFIILNSNYIADFNNILYYYYTFIFNKPSYKILNLDEINDNFFYIFYKNTEVENMLESISI